MIERSQTQALSTEPPVSDRRSFRHFFLRGLGILLPTVLTVWILVAAYNFVDEKIASHINDGVRWLIAQSTDYSAEQVDEFWRSVKLGDWQVLNVVGLFVALVAIFLIGRLLGGFIGRRLYEQGERLLLRVPLFKQVYPYVKQVTDFFVGEKDERAKFNNVVAVQYPRKGIWSIGLVTGDTMQSIENQADTPCMTIFIPSSPTPFTGYVITVPVSDTVELPITIDEALRFCVSGGVIVPQSQVIREHAGDGPGGDEAGDESGRESDGSGDENPPKPRAAAATGNEPVQT